MPPTRLGLITSESREIFLLALYKQFLVLQVSRGNLREVGIGGSGRRRSFLNGCYLDNDNNSSNCFW